MIRRHEHGQRFLRQQGLAPERILVVGLGKEAEVEPAIAEPALLFERREPGDVRMGSGVTLSQGGDEPVQGLELDVRGGADTERGLRPPGATGLGDGDVHTGEDLPGLLGERGTGVGQLDATTSPVEELNPELGLELSNRLGERRLGNVETLCGAPEVALLGHGEEVAQEPELDSVRA
jgi:hypothetical protein